ncbi:Ig-like domain-containing protein [Vibrio rumoiensis]|uniref:Ig-like domain-containing protein n=1 Tax=Vibrio rumoiensis TaxID=76258 RepID=UPI003AA95499
MAELLHGIRTIESLTGPISVIEVASSVIGVFGTSELAEPMQLYHTNNYDDAKKVFGQGSLLNAIRRVHNYVPSNSIISIPLGKDSDFPEVPEPVTSGVTFSSSSASLFIDDGATLPITIRNLHAYPVVYSSDNEDIATVDADTGVVTPVAEGVANITATVTFNDGEADVDEAHVYSITVAQTNPDAGKIVSPAQLGDSIATAFLGANSQPNGLSNPYEQTAVWSIDDEAIALVDSADGTVSPLSEGQALVTVTLSPRSDYRYTDDDGNEVVIGDVAGATLTYVLTVSKVSDALLAAFMQALPLLRKAKQKFGFSSKINMAPGILHKDGAMGLAVSAISTIRGIWVGDMPETVSTPEEAYAWKQKYTSQRSYVGWPRPKILDESGATVVDWYAPSLCGLIAQVDRNQTGQTIVPETGYWCSPSNYVMADVLGPSIELDYIPSDPSCDVNYLNVNGITTLMNHGGWKNFGNYSTAFPDKSDYLSFLSVRRTCDIIEESIEDVTRQFLDYPMFTSPTDIANTTCGRVKDTVNDYLRSKEGTALVYSSVSIDAGDNPLTNLMQGKIKYHYQMTPPVPMQSVEYEAEIYVEGLENAFNKLIA